MARITNFATLVAEVKDRADRTDMTDAQAEGFIQQAENRLSRLLRIWRMEGLTTVTTDANGLATLPTDFLSMRFVYDADKVDVPFVNVEWLVGTVTDAPKSYALVEGGLRLAPPAAETLTLLYYKRIPALTASAATNWLVTSHPDVYLYGVLAAFADWRDDEKALAKHDAAFSRALAETIAFEEANRAKGPLKMPRDFPNLQYESF